MPFESVAGYWLPMPHSTRTAGPDRDGQTAGQAKSKVPVVLFASLMGVTLLLFAAAVGGGGQGSGTQPVPGATTFGSGAFDDVPPPPASVELAPPAESNGVTSASYAVRNRLPRDLLEFYAEALDARGWTQQRPPTAVEAGLWAGTWTRDGATVEITATAGRPDVRVPEEAEDETAYEDYGTEVQIQVRGPGDA